MYAAAWKPSPKTDGDGECEFRYQPDGWKKEYRFVALRYEKAPEEMGPEEAEQYQLFETSQYKYRVFVTDFSDSIDMVVWLYRQRGGADHPLHAAAQRRDALLGKSTPIPVVVRPSQPIRVPVSRRRRVYP